MKNGKPINRNLTVKVALLCAAIGWLCWGAGNFCNAQTQQTNPAGLSPDLQEVVTLSRQQMGDDVITNYIRSTGKSYRLSADDIIYLKNQGVSQGVISALLQTASSGSNPADQNPPSAPPMTIPASTQTSPGPVTAGSAPPSPASSPSDQTASTAPSDETPAISASPQPDESAPAVVAPTSLQVPANVPWFDTGIDISANQSVSIAASGLVHYKPGDQYVTTPAGESAVDRNSLAPGLPVGSLVGKIGQSGEPFEIGTSASFTAPEEGRLYLSYNDRVGAFGDNSGSWDVTVSLGQTSSQPVVNFAYFHAQLAPYGTWVEVPGYGQCWSPTQAIAANPNWRPYYDMGQWVQTDNGLYWQSDYTWGDIPFHYGRWFLDPNYGWLWAPDYTWGPAWVFWRQDEADGAIGWAPLPVGAIFVNGVFMFHGVAVAADFDFGLGEACFTFVDYAHFHEGVFRMRGHEWVYHIDRQRLHSFYGRSVLRNDFRRDEHGRFVNNGIGRDRVERLTHVEHANFEVRNPVGDRNRLAAQRAEDARNRNPVVGKPGEQRPGQPVGRPGEPEHGQFGNSGGQSVSKVFRPPTPTKAATQKLPTKK